MQYPDVLCCDSTLAIHPTSNMSEAARHRVYHTMVHKGRQLQVRLSQSLANEGAPCLLLYYYSVR